MTTTDTTTTDWTGRIDTKTVVERTAQAIAARHIGRLTGFDRSEIADELYGQAETAERWDISKALEASDDTAEIQAVRERLEQIVEQIRTQAATYANEVGRLTADNARLLAERDELRRQVDYYQGPKKQPGRLTLVSAEQRAPLYAAYKAAREWAEKNGESFTDDGIIQAAVKAYRAELIAQAKQAGTAAKTAVAR